MTTTSLYESPAVTSAPPCANYWIYGIIPRHSAPSFGLRDQAGAAPVFCFAHAGLAAVVSHAPPPPHPLPRPEALRMLLRHQQILEQLLPTVPVLPVSLGTCMPNEGRLRALLEQGAPLFHAAFAELAGRIQIEVVARWDAGAVLAQVAAEPALVALRATLAALPPEQAPAALADAGRLVKASLDRRRAALREQVLRAIGGIGADCVVNANSDDTLIVSAALLVNADERALLDARLDALDAQLAASCPELVQLQMVGALPPYSFANVTVELPDPHAIEAARQLLGLPERIATGKIRRAYRRAAALHHPDHNRGDSSAGARITALAQAQSLLLRYAAAQGPDCDFRAPAVAQTLLIAVRRQGDQEQAGAYVA